MLSAPINTFAAGNTLIVPGVPGNVVRVVGYLLSAVGHNTCLWQSSGGSVLGGAGFGVIGESSEITPFALPAAIVAPQCPRSEWGYQGWFDTLPGEGLVLNLSDSNQIVGHVSYVITAPGGI